MTEKGNEIGVSTFGNSTLTQTSVSVSSSSKTYCTRSRPTSATADVEYELKSQLIEEHSPSVGSSMIVSIALLEDTLILRSSSVGRIRIIRTVSVFPILLSLFMGTGRHFSRWHLANTISNSSEDKNVFSEKSRSFKRYYIYLLQH